MMMLMADRTGEASCLLTTGEHEYTRYGFRELIERCERTRDVVCGCVWRRGVMVVFVCGHRRCVDILQPDITWVGGLTEAKKIYSMAAAYDIPGEHPRPHSIPSHMWAAAHRVT
jgi:L-rhamnonate dehydratase